MGTMALFVCSQKTQRITGQKKFAAVKTQFHIVNTELPLIFFYISSLFEFIIKRQRLLSKLNSFIPLLLLEHIKSKALSANIERIIVKERVFICSFFKVAFRMKLG